MQARRWHDAFSSSELHGRDLDHNVTILLGVATSQGQDIRAIKERLDGIDEKLNRILALLKGRP